MKRILFFICGSIFAANISAQTWDCGAEGPNVRATFSNETLTISGEGRMKNYDLDNPAPWYHIRNSIKTVNFNDNILWVGALAFYNCVNLTSVIFPDGPMLIGQGAFANCTSLTSIIIPNNVGAIGVATFMDCSELTHATFGDKFSAMGVGAFANCSKLRSITISNPNPPAFHPKENAENISVNFSGMDLSSIILYVPQAALANYRSAVGWKEFRNIQAIGSQAGSGGNTPTPAQSVTGITWYDMLKQAISANPRNTYDNGDRYKGQAMSDGMGVYLWSIGNMYFGSLKENKKNGSGIYQAPDGVTILNCPDGKYYAGNWSNDKKSGTGSCYDATGKLLYRGEFKDDRPVGAYPSTGDNAAYKLEVINYDDRKYMGETYNGRRHGYGIIVWQTGDLWFGWFKDGIRDGSGLYIYNNGNLLTGTWKGDTHTPMTTAGATKDNNNIQSIVDQIDKAGRLPAALIAALNAKELTWQDALKQAISANPRHSWDNGDRYKGQDRVNGMGACLWSRGDMFFGSYRENKINGYGIGITVDGETVSNCPNCKFYAGNWSDNVKNGAGSCYDATGKLLYRGEFKDNRPVGVYPSTDDNAAYRFTIIVYGDGSKYIGETFNGRMHGYGIFVWQTGELWIGWFKDGTRDGAGLSIHSDGKLVTGTWQGNTHTPSETDITWDMLKQAISANPTTIYDNGRYKGQNMSNGMGAYLWNDGSMSFGNYRKKIFNGYGIAIMNDVQTINNCPGCKYYAGNWSNDVKSGAGSCFDASGKLLYRGEFRDDRPVDAYPSTDDNAAYKFEIIHYTDGKYIGETFNGRGHGYGIYVWQTGDLWFGWWKDGIRDGTGLLIYNNGKLLTGTWKGDKHAR